MTDQSPGVLPRVNGKAVVKEPTLVVGIDRLMLVTVVVHFLLTGG